MKVEAVMPIYNIYTIILFTIEDRNWAIAFNRYPHVPVGYILAKGQVGSDLTIAWYGGADY